MINICNKINCCGCNACVQICPQKCIIMEEDYEGFLYPKIELQKCINCRLCEKVCPVLNRFSSSTVLDSYACYTYNEYIQEKSSSGGIIYEISKYVLEKKELYVGLVLMKIGKFFIVVLIMLRILLNFVALNMYKVK
ncbi:4Fe-4S dicluster domain-containing protein [Bacteroides sp. BFG-257]|uniref:4Fe-4S dicluster domain-containing protein n=1 Tax=Bacteroides sp. BFG-257 TaxID=2972761 RepID=UPI002161F0A9|nr:4Fe-4S dicluster domain-containing protein [Bacteroides sp. BFG-257]UVO97542.1 4Fe-4S dicluster domain-containing protein [Bacteroides sp. BFG-257]